jgi:membrane protein DedA with SNARE-associated domain
MTDAVHHLVERYGLIAVFLGCTAEGESTAILAGFFAHQRVFELWHALAIVFLGAFSGDSLLFLAGRRFADTRLVKRLRNAPGFDRAFALVQEHPVTFVLLNRYAYGVRLAGGVAAGLSGIPMPKFLALNALSAAVWAGLFCSVGYVFGLAAETIIGAALAKHERLLVGLAIGLAAALLGWGLARYFGKRAAVGKPAAVRSTPR